MDFKSFINHTILHRIGIPNSQCGLFWIMCKPCVHSVLNVRFQIIHLHTIPTHLANQTHSLLFSSQCGLCWITYMCKTCVHWVVTLWGFRSFIYTQFPQCWHTKHTATCSRQCGLCWTMCKPCVHSVVTMLGFKFITSSPHIWPNEHTVMHYNSYKNLMRPVLTYMPTNSYSSLNFVHITLSFGFRLHNIFIKLKKTHHQ